VFDSLKNRQVSREPRNNDPSETCFVKDDADIRDHASEFRILLKKEGGNRSDELRSLLNLLKEGRCDDDEWLLPSKAD
jgi:hypothetical protein